MRVRVHDYQLQTTFVWFCQSMAHYFWKSYIQEIGEILVKGRDIVQIVVLCHKITRFVPVPGQADIQIGSSAVFLESNDLSSSLVCIFVYSSRKFKSINVILLFLSHELTQTYLYNTY